MKRIDIVAVATDENTVIMCTAPYMSNLYTGDLVEVEEVSGFGTVLIRDNVELGSKDFEVLDRECLLRKVLKRVDFSVMNWNGYEEEKEDE